MFNMVSDRITISVVSHGQAALVHALLKDLACYCGDTVGVILTLNIPESLPFSLDEFPFPVRLIRNASRKGFGANHNAAFRQVKADYLAILNPDVRLYENPFPALVGALSDPEIGIVAPLILHPGGRVEDSARRFPTPLAILRNMAMFYVGMVRFCAFATMGKTYWIVCARPDFITQSLPWQMTRHGGTWA